MLEWLYIHGDWRHEISLSLPRRKVLHVRLRCKLVDWRLGFYVEPGTHGDEIGFLDIAPLPTISILFALYRRDR